ncbi:MAG TPA: 50S ribosomal protein L11 methyltransferase [Caulobacteraceae bacterium]|nr:50S ribosomal protein L11 methyltransferase [Caulobacteraceae bacterium]
METEASVDAMIATFERALEGRPGYALGMAGLAEVARREKRPLKAYELACKALAAAPDDPEVVVRARRLLHGLAPRYHVRMMNEPGRNAAWDSALRRAIGPQTRALEIGTGAGMLALMAARAGARKVTTCEISPLMARLASQIVEANGYADRIDVVAKSSLDLAVGVDLDEPADLLFCDIFGDDLVSFDPLPLVADARRRLCKPDARVIPAAAVLRVALAHFEQYPLLAQISSAAGFDFAPFAGFAPAKVETPVGTPGLKLLSEPADLFRFDLASDHPRQGRAEVALQAAEDALLNGVIGWLRLELDAETALDARPDPDKRAFARPAFWPLPAPVQVRRGDVIRVCGEHRESVLTIWRGA